MHVEHGAPSSKLHRCIIFRVYNFKKLLFVFLNFATKEIFFKFKFKRYMFFYLKALFGSKDLDGEERKGKVKTKFFMFGKRK